MTQPPSATMWPSCECGTFAIGHCMTCTSPVCGDHSLSGRHRICLSCKAHKETEDHARRAEASARNREASLDRAPAPCGHGTEVVAPDGHCWTCQMG